MDPRFEQWPERAGTIETVAAGATMDVITNDMHTQVNVTGAMAAAGTITVAVGENVRKGAKLLIKATSDGTGRTLTFGTGFTGKAFAITASKTANFYCEYDGSAFVVLSALLQD